MDVLARVIPFFMLVAVGVVLGRVSLVDLAGARALSAYVFWVAFPALLIHSLSAMAPPDAAMAAGLAAYAVGVSAVLALALVAGRLMGWSRPARAGTAMASINANTAFLGAPLSVALFGAAAQGPSAALVAIDCTLIMALGTAMVRGAADDSSLWKAAAKTLRNPLVVAALIGAGLSFAGLRLIAPLETALGMLRATASPVGLVALGIVVGLEAGHGAREDAAPVSLAVAFKLLLAPVLVWLLVGLTEADPMFRATATLLAACPTAVHVFIQTRTYGVFARGGAMAVVLSTIGAAISLPILGAALIP